MTNTIIAQAVEHLRSAAMDRAEQEARKIVEKVESDLKANDMDLEKVAPYPKSNIGRPAYQSAMAKRLTIQLVSKANWTSKRPDEPDTRVMDQGRIDKFVQSAREDASFSYDKFIAKLNEKCGDVQKAELSGNHVWGFSILHVTKADGSVEKWKTQQIINVSKLGKLFNQWPTRKVK